MQDKQYTVYGRREGRDIFKAVQAVDEAAALEKARKRWPFTRWQNAELAGTGQLADAIDQFMRQGELGVSHAG